MDQIRLAHDRFQWWALVNTITNITVPEKSRYLLTKLGVSKKDSMYIEVASYKSTLPSDEPSQYSVILVSVFLSTRCNSCSMLYTKAQCLWDE